MHQNVILILAAATVCVLITTVVIQQIRNLEIAVDHNHQRASNLSRAFEQAKVSNQALQHDLQAVLSTQDNQPRAKVEGFRKNS